MKPTITITESDPARAHGFTVEVRDDPGGEVQGEYDVYILVREDRKPYLALVGEPDAMHGWECWRGYEVWGLMGPEESEKDGVPYRGPTPEMPHDEIVRAAVTRFLRDEAQARADLIAFRSPSVPGSAGYQQRSPRPVGSPPWHEP